MSVILLAGSLSETETSQLISEGVSILKGETATQLCRKHLQVFREQWDGCFKKWMQAEESLTELKGKLAETESVLAAATATIHEYQHDLLMTAHLRAQERLDDTVEPKEWIH